jgi:hypothetical protein
MTISFDVAPLTAIPRDLHWDRTVAAAKSPIFFSSRFLQAIAAAPLLSTESASLLWLDNGTGAVTGIPVFRQSSADPLHDLSHLQSELPGLSSSSGLLSHCWHCYDSQIISSVGDSSALKTLVDAMRSFARTLSVEYFGLVNVADGRTLNAMVEAGVRPHYMTDRYVLDLTAHSGFEDYIAALEPDSRRELKRQFRRYEQSGAELSVEAMPIRDLDEAVLLCRQTAARYDFAFYYPEMETRLLLDAMGDSLRLVSVRSGGERVGVLVCFLDPPRLHVWAGGMRYDRTTFSPYALAFAEAIRFAFAENIEVVEGGRSNGRVKRRNGFVPVQLYACLQRI